MSGIPSWARVGAKVVCVDDFEDRFVSLITAAKINPVGDLDGLTKGQIYTIRDICEHPQIHGWMLIRLREIIRPVCAAAGEETGFDPSRFRPLITQSDDISAHFAHLLVSPVPHLEEAA